MRTTLFVSTLLATALFGGTALAERTGDDATKPTHVTSARELKERIVRESSEHHDTSTKIDNRATEKAPRDLQRSRPKGDTYDHYGQGATKTGTPTAANNNSSKITKTPAVLMPGRAHGDTIDPTSSKRTASSSPNNGIQTTVGSTQLTWSAGDKNVRSFVHFTNDKGQTNNDIHGATASGMKMRIIASIIMNTAGLALIHKSWETTGGDAMSLFPGD